MDKRGGIEIIRERPGGRGIKAAIFDFDGTISTLRCGWEKIMAPLMLEAIGSGVRDDQALRDRIDRYIDASTGIQTIYQMQWLAEQVREEGLNPAVLDPWEYKDEYNRRLMAAISGKIESVERGEAAPGRYMVAGAREFLHALRGRGVRLYLASGTDHDDVCREAKTLGVYDEFELVKGAPARVAACSKEAVIRMIMEEQRLGGGELALIGDGKVEIALGVGSGALAVGVASDEERLSGVNPVKRDRLIRAGAHLVIGDFLCAEPLMELLFPARNERGGAE